MAKKKTEFVGLRTDSATKARLKQMAQQLGSMSEAVRYCVATAPEPSSADVLVGLQPSYSAESEGLHV